VERREKSRANREQLRCCNWIRLPRANRSAQAGGEGGRKVGVVNAMPKARSQNIRPFHLIRAFSVAAVYDRRPSAEAREKTSSQKEE